MSDAAAPVFDRTIIDYLRVTSDDGDALRDVLRGPVEKFGRGLGVYPEAERDGFGAVFCSGGPEGGRCMLQLSGEPLACFRSTFDQHDLVSHLASSGARCTRIDLARDTSGEMTPYLLRDYLDADRYVTVWKNPPVYTQEQRGPLTVRLGSRKSDFMLRVYDKRGELLASDKPCPHERLSRWEAEIKGELAAHAFGLLYCEPLVIYEATGEATGGESWPIHRLHASWLAQRLRLTTERVRRASKEQSRAVTDPAWTAFVAESNGVDLVAEEDKRTPAQQATEFARSFMRGNAGSFATFEELAGPDGVAELRRQGALRRSAKHRMFIERIGETRTAVLAALGLTSRRSGAASRGAGEAGRPRIP